MNAETELFNFNGFQVFDGNVFQAFRLLRTEANLDTRRQLDDDPVGGRSIPLLASLYY